MFRKKDKAKKLKTDPKEHDRAAADTPELKEDEARALAFAYAKYLRENNMEPGDPTFVRPEELGVITFASGTEFTMKTPENTEPLPECSGRALENTEPQPEFRGSASAPEYWPEAAAERKARRKPETAASKKTQFASAGTGRQPGAAAETQSAATGTGRQHDAAAETQSAVDTTGGQSDAATESVAFLDISTKVSTERAKKPGEAEIRALALAYAKYLKENNMQPGDPTYIDTDEEDAGNSGNAENSGDPEYAEIPAAFTDSSRSTDTDISRTTFSKDKNKEGWEDALQAELAAMTSAANVQTEASEIHSIKTVPSANERKGRKELEAELKKAEKEEREAQKQRRKTEQEQLRIQKEKEKQARKKAKAQKKAEKQAAAKGAAGKFNGTGTAAAGSGSLLSNLVDFHDRIQDRTDEAFAGIGRDFARGAHAITATYRHSRRSIGFALLMTGVIVAGILLIFDRFTVYEYAYNGKVLGYVSEQEEVTDVLEIAGKKLTQNSSSGAKVEFTLNQNVTFNEVDGRGKSTDDADTAVNKLIYMTDIETEAFAIYDGDRIVAIVKDQAEAEELLTLSMEELSTPDSGMELISAKFVNELSIESIKVLLGSVQSRETALKQMVEGGEMNTFHIVEEGETVASLAEEFGVDEINIYDEDNKNAVSEIEQGDRVCIRSILDPVNVKMKEKGRLKEVIEYETIKKNSDEYYQGDSYVKQEGVNGIQIFEGTLTKVGGEVTKRDEDSIEIIREKQDKIILVGTKERPKTAPTGTFAMPIQRYVITSEFGGRWGRMHEGMDFGASTGTSIYASDGGTVVRAEYYSGYGLCVDIDHENGRMTRYGHCSRLLVSKGDKVYQGQEIAKVGSTGHSTGPHLHFEVRIDGTAQNPRKYLDL